MLIVLTPAGFEGWFKELSVPAPAMTLRQRLKLPTRTYKECSRLLRDMA
jgi:hypothetical protein